tara:strand:+ start:176 stop:1303 length:1128 start_codon:yes stop_codon:yes gene_type:complete
LSCGNEDILEDVLDEEITDNDDDINKDDDEDTSRSAEEDQKIVEDGIQTLLSCIEELESGELSNLLIKLYDNADADYNNSTIGDYHETMVEAIENIPNYQPLLNSIYPEERLNASNYYGIYTYNKLSNSWSTSTSNSEIRLIFPMYTNSTSNDTYITLSNMTEEYMSIEDPIYFPTKLLIEMFHMDEKMFGIDVSNVDYKMSGEIPVPEDVDVSIYTNPFTHDISIDKIYDDEFSLDYSLSNGSGCITEISGVVKLLSTDYENLEDNDIDQILLNINTNGMKFDVDIDAERLFAIDDPSTTQFNYFIDVEVYSGNTLLGELELQEDENEEYYVNMIFVDGTVVNTEYFKGIGIQADDFIETIEGIIARYTDRLDD